MNPLVSVCAVIIGATVLLAAALTIRAIGEWRGAASRKSLPGG